MPRYKGAHLTWNDRLTIEKIIVDNAKEAKAAAKKTTKKEKAAEEKPEEA